MIGILLITHSSLGETFLSNARVIVGEQPQIGVLSQRPGGSYQVLRQKVADEIERLDQGQGVLILVDIYGGTPSNVALSFLKERHIAITTGLNMAMLLKVLEANRSTLSLEDLAHTAMDAGKRCVAVHQHSDSVPEQETLEKSTVVRTGARNAVAEVTVLNALGLHASTSAKLVKLANKYKSEIFLVKENTEVNAKSIMGVLMLAASQGTKLEIRAEGDDAYSAVMELRKLFENKFDED